MRRFIVVAVIGLLVIGTASAQSAGSQDDAAAKSKTAVQAGQAGAQAQGSAQASQEAKASKEQSAKKEGSAQASGSGSASASAQAGQHSINLSSDSVIEATLQSAVDVRKNKEGDPVVARTTKAVKSGKEVVIPKGAKLVGHVTQAKARSKGQAESALGIVFDHCVFKDGREVPVNVVVQAVAAAQTVAAASADDTFVAGSGSAAGSGRAAGSGGGLVGSVGSTAGAAAGTVTNAAGSVGGTAASTVNTTARTATGASGSVAASHAVGALNSSSQGVIGLPGLSLSSAASSGTQGSVIVSSLRNVRLESGTRLLLRGQGHAQ